MKFGRVEDPAAVLHSLPNLTRISPYLQPQSVGSGTSIRLYAGAPAWGDKGFVGKIYPPKAMPADYLYHYSRHFGCVELNATYYRIPTADTVRSWTRQTPTDFLFCPKFPQQISNQKTLSPQGGILDGFLQFCLGLGDQLGTTFLQLPQHFSPAKLRVLEDFLRRIPDDLSVMVEFRHPDWFDGHSLCDGLFELLSARGAGAVITDTSGRRDVLHFDITGRDLFIRFTGNRLHTSDYERLDDWARQIGQWKRLPVQRIFFMMHQPEEHWCVDTAQHLSKSLQKAAGISIKTPTTSNDQLWLF